MASWIKLTRDDPKRLMMRKLLTEEAFDERDRLDALVLFAEAKVRYLLNERGEPQGESDAFVPKLTAEEIDAVAGCEGFAAALERVGKVRFQEGGTLFLDCHNDNPIPFTRVEERERKAAYRAGKSSGRPASRPGDVPEMSHGTFRDNGGCPVDVPACPVPVPPLSGLSRTQEEIRFREEKKKDTVASRPAAAAASAGERPSFSVPRKNKKSEAFVPPPELNTPEFLEEWAKWLDYLEEKRKRCPSTAAKHIELLKPMGPERAIAAMACAIERGYAAPIEPDPTISNWRQKVAKRLASMNYPDEKALGDLVAANAAKNGPGDDRPSLPGRERASQAAIAVVGHYHGVVKPKLVSIGAFETATKLIRSGEAGARLKAAADGYAAWCEESGAEPAERLSAKEFFAEGGKYAQYLPSATPDDGVPARDAPAELTVGRES